MSGEFLQGDAMSGTPRLHRDILLSRLCQVYLSYNKDMHPGNDI